MTINIDIKKEAIQQLTKALSSVLADTYVLYVKTQNFHWNIVDPRFYSLHKMFQEQYEAMALAIDEIAERIRMLGEVAPGSLQEFIKLASLKESSNQLSGEEMLKTLLADHEAVVRNLRKFIHQSLDLGDDGTSDMMIELIRFHEKTSWMLRAHFPK